MKNARFYALLTCATALSACGGQSGVPLPVDCIAEINPPGVYTYAAVDIPTVIPSDGGTQAGADALNACIREKSGGVPAQTTSAQVATSTVQNSGTRTTQTYTYGTPPPAAAVDPISGQSVTLLRPRQCNLQMTGGTGYTCAIGR